MWLWIILGVVGLFFLVIFALVIRLGIAMKRGLAQGNAELQAALATLQLPEIGDRANECVTTAQERFGVSLDFDDWQASAIHLDELLSKREQKTAVLRAFEKPGLTYYAFIPIGSFLGQLLERHSKAVWKKEADSVYLEVPVGDGQMTTWPFEKVQKHFWEGEPGDLVAYVAMHVNAEAMVARMRQT